MKETVYIETSVISYYTAKPSRDLVIAGRQEITREKYPKILGYFEHHGYKCPIICSPEELLGE